MRRSILLLLLLATIPLATKAQEIFSIDFSSDPAGNFIVYDLDRNTPSSAMQAIGFKVGTPWCPIRESDESTNVSFGSTSSYTPAGQANDWLVTKGLEISTDKCVLEWKSQAYDPKKRDGLKVFISTKGQAVSDFPQTAAWEVEEEEAGSSDPDKIEGEWVNHSISLEEYAGKTIYIAFVNQSNNKSLILIDDVWVGRRSDYEFALTTEKYVDVPEAIITGTFKVLTGIRVDSYTVHYSYGDNEYSRTYEGLNLGKDGTHTFTFDQKIPLELNKTVSYKVWVDVNSETSLKPELTVTRVAYFPKRNVVIEEGTGTWCGNCVLGLWAMEYLREHYSEDGFIGIAVHNNDGMTDAAYDEALGLEAFPMGVVNRKVACSPVTEDFKLETSGANPETFLDFFLQSRKEKTFSEIDVAGIYNSDSTSIEAKATVRSVITVDGVDYRVVFVLIENGVTGYAQANYFSGFGTPIGGYEKLPKKCKVPFNDVARGIWPDFQGNKNSIPSSLTAGVGVEYSLSIPIPETVKNKRYLELIGLLLNGETSEIMNAFRYPMTDEAHVGAGIENTQAGRFRTIFAEGQLIVVDDSGVAVHAELFDLTGRKLGEAIGTGFIRIPGAGYTGVAILRVNGETEKVILR